MLKSFSSGHCLELIHRVRDSAGSRDIGTSGREDFGHALAHVFFTCMLFFFFFFFFSFRLCIVIADSKSIKSSEYTVHLWMHLGEVNVTCPAITRMPGESCRR